MPIITSLEPQKHDEERVNIYLDGSFGFGASLMVVLARSLAPGQELSQTEIEDLRRDDDAERAYNAALNFLSFRPRSRREIEDYFRRNKIDAVAAESALQRLETQHLIDDEVFARFWLLNRQTFRPRGSRALRVELRQKGVAGDVIEETLSTITDEDALAYEAGLKKLRAFSGLGEREFFQKMVGFLQRRGFPYDVAGSTARRLYSEAGNGEASAGDEP